MDTGNRNPHTFCDIDAVIANPFKALRSNIYTNNRYIDPNPNLRTRYLLEGSLNGSDWFVITDKRTVDTDLSHDYIRLDGVTVRYLKITAKELPYNENFALSGLRVFGIGSGEKADAVTAFDTEYTDPMTVKLTWKPVSGAIGYNIQYGIAPDKLYNSHMVYTANEALLTTLNKGRQYYVRIDSFNEAGITEGQVRPCTEPPAV